MADRKSFDYGREDVTEVAIPAAYKVKDEILNVRTAAVRALADIVERQTLDKDTEKELRVFQASVSALYLILREKFKESDDIRKLDGAITGKEKLDLKTLYDYFCKLQKKIEDLKITKIERKEYPEGQKLA